MQRDQYSPISKRMTLMSRFFFEPQTYGATAQLNSQTNDSYEAVLLSESQTHSTPVRMNDSCEQTVKNGFWTAELCSKSCRLLNDYKKGN